MPARGTSRAEVVTELIDSAALIVGSPTLNGEILPSVADVMTYVKGLRPRNLVGSAFGGFDDGDAGSVEHTEGAGVAADGHVVDGQTEERGS